MVYTPTTWVDEVPTTSPVLYNIKDSLGNILQANVQLEVASAVTPGTPLNATNLNHIESGINDAESSIAALNTLISNIKSVLMTGVNSLFVGQSVTSNTMVDVTGSNFSLVTQKTSTIICLVVGYGQGNNSTDGLLGLQAVINGSNYGDGRAWVLHAATGGVNPTISMLAFVQHIAAGTIIGKLQVNSSVNYLVLETYSMIILAIPE